MLPCEGEGNQNDLSSQEDDVAIIKFKSPVNISPIPKPIIEGEKLISVTRVNSTSTEVGGSISIGVNSKTENSLLNIVPDNIISCKKLKSLSYNSTLNVEQELTFLDNTISTNQFASNDEIEYQVPVSSLIFTNVIASITNSDQKKSIESPHVCKISEQKTLTATTASNVIKLSNHSLMRSPDTVSIGSNVYLENVNVKSDTKELLFAEHSMLTNHITPNDGSKILSPSEIILSITKSSTEECLDVNSKPIFIQTTTSENSTITKSSFSEILSFSGKITPMLTTNGFGCKQLQCNASPIDLISSIDNRMKNSKAVSFGKSPLYTSAHTNVSASTITTMDQSRSICSQQSVDIDFNILPSKINNTIEISCDTLQCNKNENQEIQVSAGTIAVPSSSLQCSQNDEEMMRMTVVEGAEEAFSIIGEISSSDSGDAEVEGIGRNILRKSTPIQGTFSPIVDMDLLHSNDAQFNVNFTDNSNEASSMHEASQNSIEKKSVKKCNIDGRENRQHIRDLSSSPKILMSNTKFSKETVVSNPSIKGANLIKSKAKRGKPRKILKSEIICIGKETTFDNDSTSSFEDNNNYSSFSKKENSANTDEGASETFHFKKFGVTQFCDKKTKKNNTLCTVEVVEVQPPKLSPLTNKKSDEDSQHSNKSVSVDYISSPQAPLFVSNYVEVKTGNVDTTPNSSFNVIDSIAENLLKSESTQNETSPNIGVGKSLLGICHKDVTCPTDLKVSNQSSNDSVKQKKIATPRKKSTRIKTRFDSYDMYLYTLSL